MAIELHQNRQYEGAEELYRRILGVVPEHFDALHFLGMLRHQRGASDEGVALIDRATRLAPGFAGFHNNLGNIHASRGDVPAATLAYERALALAPSSADLHNNLGALYCAQDRPEEAERSYLRAIELKPDYADVHSNLGNLYDRLGRIEDAVRHCCLALVSQPQHAGARKMLAIAYHTLGRLDDAAKVYRDWLAEEPGNPLPKHYLAACTGVGVPDRANDAYVEALFDGFAKSFDAKLARLTYRAPQLIADAVAARCGPPGRDLAVLDAGCGTGLCGSHLAPYARRLTGVDLSAQMLTKASARAVYDELAKGELTAFLREHPAAYDLVASADTLCYFGALDSAVVAAGRALKADGLFVFTVEASDDNESADYHLHPHGRYSHRSGYVERVLDGAGFKRAELSSVDLRSENGRPVKGWLVSARRSTEASAGQPTSGRHSGLEVLKHTEGFL